MKPTLERTAARPKTTGLSKPTHPWLKTLRVGYAPGDTSSLLDAAADGLLEQFAKLGHDVLRAPEGHVDILFTTARYGEPVPWRQAVFFTARREYDLSNQPEMFTLVDMTTEQYEEAIAHFEQVLVKEPPDPTDFHFAGLAPQSYSVLLEQGRRGGPILALERLVQAQSKGIKVALVVGDQRPLWGHYFDLVGANPRIELHDSSGYEDLALRIVTVMSTEEVTQHKTVGEPIAQADWIQSLARKGMLEGGPALGLRSFFTDMVRISDLVQVPAVADAVANQYSEGCFATWDPDLGVLVSTVTGSARPVDKDDLKDEDLAVIVGVRPDGLGALVRHVEGKRNDPPSSEAVELMDMDSLLPKIALPDLSAQAPVVRSKLHGHRGVRAYDPSLVEYSPLEPPYYYYPVSCATSAQAEGIKGAFARSEALQEPKDPRQLAFTILPGHGVIIAEKWVPDKAPFQLMWEAMDSGALQVDNHVPQGYYGYEADRQGFMLLVEE